MDFNNRITFRTIRICTIGVKDKPKHTKDSLSKLGDAGIFKILSRARLGPGATG